ncbi:MotA/TolQ/ExbB proton channel family protein [Thiohalocapsa sp. ML1]|uniref:MotA/TolQ/ExbB proton channel family protein n=1 Tax=Thiohalocapsa sp. ML1 TaxID=1431688 RepID=UPI0009E92654|nr:MotA/TolQ/ExbB proton channel family protein [Thiohalocapsa sp. ML1]
MTDLTDSAAAMPEAADAATASTGANATAAADAALGTAANGDPFAGLWSAAADGLPGTAALGAVGARLQELLAAGGPVVAVLGVLSVIALAVVLLKLWQFQRVQLDRLGPAQAALARWQAGDTAGAIAQVAGSRQPVARLLEVALTALARPAVDLALLREELARIAAAELERLRSHLRMLELIGTLSPLLGLLGTVLGMIEAFQRLQAAGSQVDPAILSGGIWQALLTTAVGLTVAIPVVLAHAWLERRVDHCGHRMEDAATRVFTRAVAVPAPVTAAPAAAALEVGYAT